MAAPPLAQQLLTRAHSTTRALQLYDEKVRFRPLPTQPSAPSASAQDSRTLRRQRRSEARRRRNPKDERKRRARPLSAAEKRRFAVYDVPRAAQKYAVYERLHGLWVGYVQEILGLRDEGGRGRGLVGVDVGFAGPRLASADFHGAELEVVRSRCVGRVGVRGIVVRDTKFTFEIVTRGDVLKVLPKEHTVFRVAVPRAAVDSVGDEAGSKEAGGEEEGGTQQEEVVDDLPPVVFEIYGCQFENRAVDRATKKFKTKDFSKML